MAEILKKWLDDLKTHLDGEVTRKRYSILFLFVAGILLGLLVGAVALLLYTDRVINLGSASFSISRCSTLATELDATARLYIAERLEQPRIFRKMGHYKEGVESYIKLADFYKRTGEMIPSLGFNKVLWERANQSAANAALESPQSPNWKDVCSDFDLLFVSFPN